MKKNNCGLVPICLLIDNTVSMGAKGVYAFIQSGIDSEFLSANLISSRTKESARVVNKYLQELEIAGYLKRVTKSFGRSKISTTYILTETQYFFDLPTESIL